MNTLKCVTWNLLDYNNPYGVDRTREARVREQLAKLDADVYLVQEIMGRTPEDRTQTFVDLAEQLEMDCHAPGSGKIAVPAFDPGRVRRGMGIMWRRSRRLKPVPNSLAIYDWGQLANGMAAVRLMVDKAEVLFASTHLWPRTPNRRVDDCVYIAQEVRKHPLGIVGADWNNIFASRKPDGTRYDDDPYYTIPWNPGYAGKAQPNAYNGCGIARRDAMAELEHGGLIDPAAHKRAPWYRTTGHWDSTSVTQRIDGPYVTATVADATVSICSIDNEVTAAAGDNGGLSDHLPVELIVDADRLQPS